MGSQLVIAVYRPHDGKAEALLELVRGHVPLLRKEGLATDRPVVVMRSYERGEVLEIFEWASAEAAREAHERPSVAEVWGRMEEVAEFVALASLTEATRTFPHFEPVDV